MLRIPLPEDDGFALALAEDGTKHQTHGQASSGPKAYWGVALATAEVRPCA